jgi:hypothetical protein
MTVAMWPVMWAKGWWAGVVSTTTAAACSTATRTILESAVEASAAVEGHATELVWCLLRIQGGRIDLWGVLVVIFDTRLLLFCFLALFGRLLFLLGWRLLVGIAVLAEGIVLRTGSGEEGVVLNVGHEIKERMWWWVEIVDGRHDVGRSICESGFEVDEM